LKKGNIEKREGRRKHLNEKDKDKSQTRMLQREIPQQNGMWNEVFATNYDQTYRKRDHSRICYIQEPRTRKTPNELPNNQNQNEPLQIPKPITSLNI